MMTPRERFLTTINRGNPDRPPVMVTLTPQAARKLSDALGLPYEESYDSLLSTRISHMNLLTHLGNDAVGVAACSQADRPTVQTPDGLIRNEWGMVFKNAGLYNEFYSFPLANVETAVEIENYPFPDPFGSGRFDKAKQNISKFGGNYGVIGDLECAIFETSWYLTGLEKMLMDMLLEPEYLHPLLDKVMYINTETGKELIRQGVDMLWCGDDFGSQEGLLMDPDLWRSIFKPRIRKMFEEFRSVNPNIKLAWHTCGSVLSIIPDFIEVGLDILNPVQPMAKGMKPEFLKKEYGNDLIFFGGICVQDLLPNGTPTSIKEEVKRRMEIFGAGGGYIAAPAHNVQDDTPVENILAVFEAIRGE
jgi:uroporphyrinogen decarboxylase